MPPFRAALTAALFSLTICGTSYAEPGFVTVEDGRFAIDGAAYTYVGANMWYAAYLGAEKDDRQRARLEQELDHLKSLGVTNLRILGSSETSPHRDAVSPSFRDETDSYNESLLRGLDIVLAEMAERDMKAVIYLNNFWEWSGGMGTYLYWTTGEIVDPSDPDTPWPAYPQFTAQFYEDEAANALFRDYIEAVVTRTNTVTGTPYAADPTIMAWQLANEPRPGYKDEAGIARLPTYYDWLDGTAAFIKDLDPQHLVSSGSEGYMGCIRIEGCYAVAHASPNLDYLTFHIWPSNWGWLDREDMAGTYQSTAQKTEDYIEKHIEIAQALGKPTVIEEFGLDRDGAGYAPDVPTTLRNRFYSTIFGAVEDSALSGGPLMGTNFWAWGGSGRARHDDFRWRNGDGSYLGDPPHEPQGFYSVFDTDTSTIDIIEAHAEKLSTGH